MVDLQQEHQREMEGLLENVRQLNQELRLNILIIDQFIPPEYQVSHIEYCTLLSDSKTGSIHHFKMHNYNFIKY